MERTVKQLYTPETHPGHRVVTVEGPGFLPKEVPNVKQVTEYTDGWLEMECFKLDADGNYQLDAAKQDVLTETVSAFGVVLPLEPVGKIPVKLHTT